MKNKPKHILFALAFLVLSASCQFEPQKKEQVESIDAQIKKKDKGIEKERIKDIFLSLPTPLELSIMFKNEGVAFFADKLHPVSNRKKYLLTTKKALNLGVYGADLSYSGLYAHHEKTIEYFATSQILAEELGIGQTFQKKFILRIEKHATNKDTLVEVVTDFFRANDNYLKKHHEPSISTLILVGGWIEGMYLGTQMLAEGSNVKGVEKIIFNQKKSLHNILLMLQEQHQETDLSELINEVGKLEFIYNELVTSNEVDEDLYNRLINEVASLRNFIVE